MAREDITGEDVLDAPLDGVIGGATESDPRLVVELWLAVPVLDGWRCLMLLRAPEHGSFWQGVSGRVEATDPNLRMAACRELGEETGIEENVEIVDLGPWTTFQSAFSERWYRKRAIGVLLPPGAADALVLSHEHVESRLATFDQARTLVMWPGNTEALTALERHLA